MTIFFYLFLAIFLLLSGVLCLVVLVQESKSLGLGASFGGDPGESLFGTSTALVLKKLTAYLAVVFVIGCILLSLWTETLGRQGNAPIPPSIEEVTR